VVLGAIPSPMSEMLISHDVATPLTSEGLMPPAVDWFRPHDFVATEIYVKYNGAVKKDPCYFGS